MPNRTTFCCWRSVNNITIKMRRNPLLNGWFILVISFLCRILNLNQSVSYRFYSHSQTSKLSWFWDCSLCCYFTRYRCRTLSRNKPKKRTRRVKKHEGKKLPFTSNNWDMCTVEIEICNLFRWESCQKAVFIYVFIFVQFWKLFSM